MPPVTTAIVGLLVCLLGASPAALAQIARVIDSKGSSIVERAGKPSRILGQGEQLDQKDVISVARDSYAILEFKDQTRITLRPNTVFRLDTYRETESESMLFGLVRGGFRAVTGLIGKANPRAVNFTTATATIGIRGTEFDARLCQDDCATEDRRSTQPGFPIAARLVDFKGSVEALDVAGVRRKLVSGSYVRVLDEVRSARGSYAVLLLRDSGRLVLHPDTRIVFNRFRYDPARPADAEVELMLLAGHIGTKTGLIGKSRALGYRISTRFGHLETKGTTTDVRCAGACAELVPTAVSQRLALVLPPSKPKAPAWMKPAAGTVEPPSSLTLALGKITPQTNVFQAQPSTAAPTSSAQSSTPADSSASDWRNQPISGQATQALMNYAQQYGVPSEEMALLLEAVGQNPNMTYGQLQQALALGGSFPWAGPLAALFAGANNFDALITALYAPAPDWRTQTMSAEAKQAFIAYVLQTGLPGAGQAASMISDSSWLTYEQLQQMMQSEPGWEPVAAMFAGASNVNALIGALSAPPDWRMAAISDQMKQALLAYAQQHDGDVAGLQRAFDDYPTYSLLQQALAQAATYAPWVGELATMLGDANSVDALATALYASVPDWRTQTISAEAQQALILFAQQIGIQGAQNLAYLSTLTYGQLQQAIQSSPEWAPISALLAGANSVNALIAALSTSQLPLTSDALEVSVSDGAVDVFTAAGTQTVNAGQTAVTSKQGAQLLLTGMKPRPTGADAPSPQMPGIDSGGAFGDEQPMQLASGLYVWVRDGAVQLSKDGKTLDVSAGSAALATTDQIVALDAVPNFMRFDSTPRPLPAVGQRVADAFIAPDGSQSLMCTVR